VINCADDVELEIEAFAAAVAVATAVVVVVAAVVVEDYLTVFVVESVQFGRAHDFFLASQQSTIQLLLILMHPLLLLLMQETKILEVRFVKMKNYHFPREIHH
jgi:hypothetical protein